MGVGVGGLAAPTAALLLRDTPRGDAYDVCMGFWNASVNMGGIVISLAGGLAARFLPWPCCYAVMLLALPAAAYCAVRLPAGTKRAKEPPQPAQTARRKEKQSLRRVFPTAKAFGFAASYFVALPNLSLLIQENGLGDASLAGASLSVLMLGGLATGVAYSRLPQGVRDKGCFWGGAFAGSGLFFDRPQQDKRRAADGRRFFLRGGKQPCGSRSVKGSGGFRRVADCFDGNGVSRAGKLCLAGDLHIGHAAVRPFDGRAALQTRRFVRACTRRFLRTKHRAKRDGTVMWTRGV